MRTQTILAAVLIASAGGFTLRADTTSDYERGFDLSKLRTWDFKEQMRMPRDPLGPNSTWNNRIREAVETDLNEQGFERVTTAPPDFLVAYYMGTEREHDTRLIGYGFPGGWRRWGWGRGWGTVDVWRIPYTESTLVIDVIDGSTNQLVWRGYDTQAIDLNKSEKTINESVEKLVKRFVKESRHEKKEER